MQTYIFARGEDIALALDATSGDPTTVTQVTAQLKAIPAWRAVLPAATQAAANFTVTARAASGTIPAGWTLLIPAALSATLASGNYITDALIQVAGGTAITEQVSVRLREAVTALN